MNLELSSIYSQGGLPQKPSSTLQLDIASNLIPSIAKSQDLQQFLSNAESKEWLDKRLENSTVYYNNDKLLWGPFLIIIYKDPETKDISTLTIDKLGLTSFPHIDISKKSKYYPAIENLPKEEQNSNIKKTLAVCLLEKFSQLNEDHIKAIAPHYPLKFEYDQTYAGELASKCKLFTLLTPEKLGIKLSKAGFFSSNKSIKSTLLDVVYENNEKSIDSNNKLVFHLGEQLEQLFNPITEYSPEQTEYNYKPPGGESVLEEDGPLTKAIINELLQFQSNFTFNLVEFLHKVLITLRVRVLNDEIDGLSTVKLNRLFPPTIDEVTRINCIFLDSLKAATPYGSLEILKACSLTIPYFYKAYTRHEAATKNFSKDIKLFLRNFQDILPEKDIYNELKIETIIKGPQEKLIKLKLIIDRLFKSKKSWVSITNESLAKKEYTNIMEVIDSFGKLDKPLSSYNTRVFTPSGKILTELAKGWPVELQYKWLKRRVVGVYDMIDTSKSNNRNVLVIFSDYIVFLSIIDFENYYTTDGAHKPLISDILMNSLINEVPLPSKIPKLQVEKYSYIDKIFVSVFDEKFLRIDAIKGDDSFSVTCQLANPKTVDVTYISDLITKAKILEKDTAFHLFKAYENDIILYSTAHELEAYNNERIKSPFALFLNIEPSASLLAINNLQSAVFAKFIKETDEEEIIKFTIISPGSDQTVIDLPSHEIITKLIENISKHTSSYYSSVLSPLAKNIMTCNISLLEEIKNVTDEPLTPTNDHSSQKLIIQQVNSENKQSYGTITTFRSNTSDLRENDEEEEKKSKAKISTKKALSPAKTKQKIQKSTSDKPKISLVKKETHQKKNIQAKNVEVKRKEKKSGLFGIFKSLFGSSMHKTKKSNISKPMAVTNQTINSKNNPNTTSIPTPTSMRKIQTPAVGNRLSKINLVPVTEELQEKDRHEEKKDQNQIEDPHSEVPDDASASQVRISSVVRNSIFGKKFETDMEDKKDKIPSETDGKIEDATWNTSHPKEDLNPSILPTVKENKKYIKKDISSTQNMPMEAPKVDIETNNAPPTKLAKKITTLPQLSNIPTKEANKTLNMNDDIFEDVNSTSEVDTTEVSHSTVKTRDIVNKGLARDMSAQSQVFNNDLFGDFVEDIPTVKKSSSSNGSPQSPLVEIEDKNSVTPTMSVESTISISSPESKTTIENLEVNKDQGTSTDRKIYAENNTSAIDTASTHEQDEQASRKEKADKFHAFPELPHIPISRPHTAFERSPSFIELFQGMRMVLDKNDAKYNWKRIPSTTSLNNNLLLDPSEKNDKMESVPEELPENTGTLNSASDHPSPLPESVSTSSNSRDDSIDNVEINIKPEDDSVASENTYDLEKSVNQVVQSMFKEDNTKVPPSKSPSSFKVVNSSPSRYLNRPPTDDESLHDHIINNTINHLKGPDIDTNADKSPLNRTLANESNIGSDFSFPSDIHHGPDKRWLELSFASQDDIKNIHNPSVESLDNNQYATPLEEPTDTFQDTYSTISASSAINITETLDTIDHGMPSMNDAQNTTNDSTVHSYETQDTATEVDGIHQPSVSKPVQGVQEQHDNIKKTNNTNDKSSNSLLDDLEFSSFNMTFDSTTNNELQYTSSNNILSQLPEKNNENASLWNKVPNLQQKNKGPVVYRLSRGSTSDINAEGFKKGEDFNKLSTKSNEDDPIWVSPSKIDFAISPEKINKTAANRISTNSSNITKSISNTNNKKSDLIEDSSFAFLADIVNNNDDTANIYENDSENASEDDIDYKNDKPERLQFVK
ncbi:bud site selection protein 3 [Monosporozyma servazzii]